VYSIHRRCAQPIIHSQLSLINAFGVNRINVRIAVRQSRPVTRLFLLCKERWAATGKSSRQLTRYYETGFEVVWVQSLDVTKFDGRGGQAATVASMSRRTRPFLSKTDNCADLAPPRPLRLPAGSASRQDHVAVDPDVVDQALPKRTGSRVLPAPMETGPVEHGRPACERITCPDEPPLTPANTVKSVAELLSPAHEPVVLRPAGTVAVGTDECPHPSGPGGLEKPTFMVRPPFVRNHQVDYTFLGSLYP
jgi:hypothetical protein